MGNPPTLMLSSSNTQVSGNAGCNRMAGPCTLGNGTIEFGPLALTRMDGWVVARFDPAPAN